MDPLVEAAGSSALVPVAGPNDRHHPDILAHCWVLSEGAIRDRKQQVLY